MPVHSRGSKQEEVEMCAQSQSFDFIGIMETRWDSSHNWRATTRNTGSSGKIGWEGKEEVSGSMQRSVLHAWSFYLDRWKNCRKLACKKQRTNQERKYCSVCYRPDQEEKVDKDFFKQTEKVSWRSLYSWFTLTAPISSGRAAQQGAREKSRRFLQCIEDIF